MILLLCLETVEGDKIHTRDTPFHYLPKREIKKGKRKKREEKGRKSHVRLKWLYIQNK
jgi:hypothetical protein